MYDKDSESLKIFSGKLEDDNLSNNLDGQNSNNNDLHQNVNNFEGVTNVNQSSLNTNDVSTVASSSADINSGNSNNKPLFNNNVNTAQSLNSQVPFNNKIDVEADLNTAVGNNLNGTLNTLNDSASVNNVNPAGMTQPEILDKVSVIPNLTSASQSNVGLKQADLSSQISNIPNQSNRSNKYLSADDEKYLEAYIGPNYKKIISGKFSFSAFFFTFGYLFYRKMYLAGVLLALIEFIIINLVQNALISCVIIIFMDILLGLFFNKIYIRRVMMKIEKLKIKYQSSPQALLTACTLKGGRSLPMAILMSIIIFVVQIIISMVVFSVAIFDFIFGNANINVNSNINSNSSGENNTDSTDGSSTSKIIYFGFMADSYVTDNFNMTIPSNFVQDGSDYVVSTQSNRSSNSCSFSFQALSNYTDVDTLINDISSVFGAKTAETQTNNIMWQQAIYQQLFKTTYYTATQKDGIVYLITYEINYGSDKKKCEDYYNEIMNSISYK